MRRRAYARLFDALDRPNARFVLHTATYGEIALSVAAFAARPRAGRLAVILRFDPGGDRRAQQDVSVALAPAARAPVTLFSDSEDLAAFLRPLAPLDITVVPPPAAAFPSAEAGDRMGYFGAMRPQKGFHRLPAILEAIRSARPDIGFDVQAYAHAADGADPACLEARERLRASSGVRLLERPLSEEDYAAILAECAVALLPYDSNVYRRGTSGVFVDVIAAGGGAIVPEGVWMAQEAAREGLECVCAVPSEPQAWADAALWLFERRAAPRPRAKAWAERHTYDALVRALLSEDAASVARASHAS